jgi:adenylate kinase
VIIAITGSPGVGKTSVAQSLRPRGYALLDLTELAREMGAMEPGSDGAEVDLEAVAAGLRPASDTHVDTVVQSTWAHLLPVDEVVVLRCHPRELRERLNAKKWPDDRIRETLEAEVVDVIAVEVLESGIPACEVDTTGRSADAVAEEVDRILRGEEDGRPPGTVDWSEEVLNWY